MGDARAIDKESAPDNDSGSSRSPAARFNSGFWVKGG
jgi:hypothetical protein